MSAPFWKDANRNKLCHCGSGKKYKRCCQRRDVELAHEASEKARTSTNGERVAIPVRPSSDVA